MGLKEIARRMLPPIALDAGRWLRKSPTPLSIHYEAVPGWPNRIQSFLTTAATERYKTALETFDLSASLESPIVRDNLTLLSMIGLSEATLLDFGCGNGIYCRLLAVFPTTARWKYVGADINAELIEWCRAMYSDTRFEVLEESGARLFRDDEFDVVLASGAVQYIKDCAGALSELHRVTRDRVLISRIPLWRYHPTQIVLQHVSHECGEEHHPMHVFNRDMLNSLLTRLGFALLFRDYGSEFFHVPGVSEPVVLNSYLLQKIRVAG
jgi:putative methyltransferase (TIGR04325 family)